MNTERRQSVRVIMPRGTVGGTIAVLLIALGTRPALAQSCTDTTWLPSSQTVFGFHTGAPGYLAQIQGYPSTLYSARDIFVFGPGEIMLLSWNRDAPTGHYAISFAFFDQADVDMLLAAPDRAGRDVVLNTLTAGALTQTTPFIFEGQAGQYFFVSGPPDQPTVIQRWLIDILLDPLCTPQIQALLTAKYGAGSPQIADAFSLMDDLALDAQIYPGTGTYTSDTRLAIHFPGYTPGVPTINNSTATGWNCNTSMGKDPELWMNAQGLGRADLLSGNRRPAIVIGWNTHLDYDGLHTPSLDVAVDEPDHQNYLGILTAPGSAQKGLLYRAMVMLDTSWAGMPLDGDRNVVCHSTGYYLARDFLEHARNIWPAPAPTRFFAISPNIRGSGMIGGALGPQDYDSMDDMYRDNWHWNQGYRQNDVVTLIGRYAPLADVDSFVMLAYGDLSSVGSGGSMVTVAADIGVVDYSNYQPHSAGPLESLDDNEYGRRKRFGLYEGLYNMRNDGGPLNKTVALPEWNNGGDDYLSQFPPATTAVSVFNENVDLGQQGGDDGEKYEKDHSDLAQRMMFMGLRVSGLNLDVGPAPGVPVDVAPSEETPGTVVFNWTASPDQALADTPGHVGGQIYEVVRRIEGAQALAGWVDKWWQRVGLRRANGLTQFQLEYRSFETIRNVDDETPGQAHGVWLFSSDRDSEFIYVPTWLDKAFDGGDLWVRVLNGPLRGGFFKVMAVEDYVGKGFTDPGALGTCPQPQPEQCFPDKLAIRLTVAANASFAGLMPDAYESTLSSKKNYITLGGIKYQYNVAFYGPVDQLRDLVVQTTYTNSEENEDKGTGHFLSAELDAPVVHETDTIAPVISFE